MKSFTVLRYVPEETSYDGGKTISIIPTFRPLVAGDFSPIIKLAPTAEIALAKAKAQFPFEPLLAVEPYDHATHSDPAILRQRETTSSGTKKPHSRRRIGAD